MEDVFQYLPYVTTMSPSIAIAVIYLMLLLCANIYMDLNKAVRSERLFLILIFSGTIFAISTSIGRIIENELPEIMVMSANYDITMHEEFLIAIVVEMIGAMVFVPLIYGSDFDPPDIYKSLTITLIFMLLLFVIPMLAVFKFVFTTNPAIIENYIDNLRIELLSIVAIFIVYTIGRIIALHDVKLKRKRSKKLALMIIVIIVILIFIQEVITTPEYENVYLALAAAALSAFIIGIAKLHDLALYAIILLSIMMSIILLTGTQIPDYAIAPSTSINVTAELIGGITVALILDSETAI